MTLEKLLQQIEPLFFSLIKWEYNLTFLGGTQKLSEVSRVDYSRPWGMSVKSNRLGLARWNVQTI